MTKITMEDQTYHCAPGQSVLDVLLDNGVAIPFGCRQGVCQSCQLRSIDEIPPSAAQNGLKDTLKKQRHFLACQCHPDRDMMVSRVDSIRAFHEGTVVGTGLLNRNTMRLLIDCPQITDFYAGQFVNIQREDGLTRSYSIAGNHGDSTTLEFHIRRLPGGRFTQWLHDEIQPGDNLRVSEPQGFCFYLPERKQQGLLLVGTGSGLAPLSGILDDAIRNGHTGPIHLFHGSRTAGDLYLVAEFMELAQQHRNFNYTPCISGTDVPPDYTRGRVNDVVVSRMNDLTGWTVYLCGHPGMVDQMKMAAFMKGASVANIYCDAFFVDQSVA